MTRRAAIIGGGVIGGGWAARFILNGWDVAVFDPDPEAARKIQAVLENARRSLPMLYETRLPAEGRLLFVARIADAVAGADWVQESVPERLEIKHATLAEIDQAAPETTIIGSSTSGFKPSELRVGLAHPERVVVAHPFNPVYLLPLVELVAGDAPEAIVTRAAAILEGIGFHPLRVRKEIDAHIADRLLEAVWREALWLVRDGIATTEDIDNAIRYGFGLRWAQMGLFETYRLAGGEGGMAHFLRQFGPALAWPWTKLMDVPELTEELVQTIADQSDAQSGDVSIRALERRRDANLVALLRALKGQGSAAGALIRDHEATLPAPPRPMPGRPLRTVERVIPLDWTDYNDHMNESRYGQIFSDAADAVMIAIGADAAYVAAGGSYFTVDIHIVFKAETRAGERVHVDTQILDGRGKKLKLFHWLRRDDGTLLATAEQLLIHVSLATRRAAPPPPEIANRLGAFAAEHALLPEPDAAAD